MLFLFYVTQMAQMAQIFLAHGKIYMSHRNSCVPLVASEQSSSAKKSQKKHCHPAAMAR